MLRWGGEGEGPSEFLSPIALAVNQSTIAVADRGRVGVYTITGDVIDTYRVSGGLAVDVAFAAESPVVMVANVATGGSKAVRLSDGVIVWESGAGGGRRPGQAFAARPTLVGIGGGKVIVSGGDNYVLAVIDVETLAQVGAIGRDVDIRRVTDAFVDRVRRYMANPETAPAGWTSITGTSGRRLSPELLERIRFPKSFPVVGGAFVGPENTLWVRRGVGVGDAMAPPVEPPDGHPVMFDLFGLSDYEYAGTVEMEEGFLPLNGNGTRLAGILTAGLVQRLRAVRVTF